MKTPLTPIFMRISLVLVILSIFPAIYFGVHFFKQNKINTAVTLAPIQIKQNLFDIHHWVTPEGTQVVFVPLHELPIIDIQLVFAAGSAYDGEKFGTAQLMSQLIGEDTTDMTSDAIAEAFESVGANFNVDIGQDALSIQLRSLSDTVYRDPALQMLGNILEKTTFTETTFTREKNNLLTAIISDKQNPQVTIRDAFYEALYGPHPYAHPVNGTTQSVSALTLADIKHFHQTYFVKQNAVLAITGDLSLEAAHELSDKLIHVMPSGNSAPSIPPIPNAISNQQLLKFPSSQTHLMMGIPAIAKGNPDYFALTVGNQILGVTPLVNRLFNAVREEQGLAYNVGSALTTLKQPGPFTIYLQSRAQEADKALSLVNQTLSSYLQTGPTAAELQAAKDNLIGQFALGLSNNQAITSLIATLAFYNLPWDYPNHYQANINAVTLDDVKHVFDHYIRPDEFTLIRLGENS